MKLGWIAILSLACSIFAGCTTAPPVSSPTGAGAGASATATTGATAPLTLTNDPPVCDLGHPAVRLHWNAALGSNAWYELSVLDSTGSGFGVGRDALAGLTFYHEYQGESGGQRIVAGSRYVYTLTGHDRAGQSNRSAVTVTIPSTFCTESRPPPRETGVQWDVAANVPAKDLEHIRYGIAASGDFLAAHVGGDIPPASRSTITVKVVATGQGDGGNGGPCCYAGSPEQPGPIQLFFDVAHPQWLYQTVELRSAGVTGEPEAAHEYAHAWHQDLGCPGLWSWLEEGTAQEISYGAMAEQGFIDKATTVSFMKANAKDHDGKEWYTPLNEVDQAGVWPGDIGYLALEFAMNGTANGLTALRTICIEVAAGATSEAAFKTAFGIELPEFYQKFENWKAAQPA